MKKILFMLTALLCLTALATANTQYESITAPVEIQLCETQSFCEMPTFASEVILFERQVSVTFCNPQSMLLAVFDPDVSFRLCDIPTQFFISTELSDRRNYTNTLFRHKALLRERDLIDVKAPMIHLKKGSKNRLYRH
jgi:hypothetical protein